MLPAGCVPECPACPHRELEAAESLRRKEEWLRRRLAPWADRLLPAEGPPPDRRLGYRVRAVLAAAWDGRWGFGLHAGEEIVRIPDCPIHGAGLRAALRCLAASLPGPERMPLAWAVANGRQLTLVVKTRRRPETGWLDGECRAGLAAAGVEGLWLHLHPATGHRVLGKGAWELLLGEPWSEDAAGLRHGPRSFGQALPELHARALDHAEAWLAPDAATPVLDLCCGTGASLRRWRARGAPALGVELGAEAVAGARHNAPGAAVLQGRVAERLPQVRAWLREVAPASAAVYANPPRTGLEVPVTAWLAGEAPLRRMAMLSCSAGTLSRDLARLETGGWRLEALRPFDFLPLTLHVEILSLLSRR